MLISRGCPWAAMKRGGCKFGGSKTGAVLCPKREGGGAVVSQLVPKLKESVPPPPPSKENPDSVRTETYTTREQLCPALFCSLMLAGNHSPPARPAGICPNAGFAEAKAIS